MEGRLLLKNCAVFRADGRVRRTAWPWWWRTAASAGWRRTAGDPRAPGRLGGGLPRAARGPWPGGLPLRTWSAASSCPAHGRAPPARPRQARAGAPQGGGPLLTAEDVEALTRYALARALRAGVTLAVEHLACPADVARGARGPGPGGRAARDAPRHRATPRTASAETPRGRGPGRGQRRLRPRQRGHPRVRGALGFQSSSTCEDALLRRAGPAALGAGGPARLPPRRGRGGSRHHLRAPRPAHRGAAGGPGAAGPSEHRAHGRAARHARGRACSWTPAPSWRSRRAPRRLRSAPVSRWRPCSPGTTSGPGHRGHGTLWDEALRPPSWG